MTKQTSLFIFVFIAAFGSTVYGMEEPSKHNAIEKIGFCDFPEEIRGYIGKLAVNIIPDKSILIKSKDSESNTAETFYTTEKFKVLQYSKLASTNTLLYKQFSKKISSSVTQLFYMYLKTGIHEVPESIPTNLDILFRKNQKFLSYIDFRHLDNKTPVEIIKKREDPERYYILLANFEKNKESLYQKAGLLIDMSQKRKNSGDTHLPLELQLTIWKDNATDVNDIVEKQLLWIEIPKKDSSWCSIL